jgi:hypothetical protein
MARRDWLERFWAKVDRSGGENACWPWIGAFNRAKKRKWETEGRPRPVFWLSGLSRVPGGQIIVYAHRLSLTLCDGTSLDEHDGEECCHAPVVCDNFCCVNPRHLRWCTPEDNRRDRYGDRDGSTHVPVPNDKGLAMENEQNEQNEAQPTGQQVPEQPAQGDNGGPAEPPAESENATPATPASDR